MRTISVGLLILTAVCGGMLAYQYTHIDQAPVDQMVKPPKKTPELRALYAKERYEHMRKRLANPRTGEIPRDIRNQEKAFAATQPRLKMSADDVVSRGPSNIGGRARVLTVDLSDPSGNTMLAGGVTSGVFRSTNRGASWDKVSEFSDIHSVTTIAQDFTNPNVWYYGTGEVWSGARVGDGIWKSTDQGRTWAQLTSTSSTNPEIYDNAFDNVHRIAVHHRSGDVYAAVNRAIYRSQDGGQTWASVLGAQPTANGFFGITEVVIDLNDGRIYAAFHGSTPAGRAGVWVSETGDIGDWTQLAGGGAPQTPDDWADSGSYGRVVLALDGQSRLYALYDNGHVNDCDQAEEKPEADLFRYDGAEQGWTNLTANMPDEPGCAPGANPFAVQGGYNMALAVSPVDPNIVLVGGTSLYRSTDGFTSTDNTLRIGGYDFSNPTGFYANHHPDIQWVTFDPTNPAILLSGTDGGLHQTEVAQPQPAWDSLNNGFVTLQYYHVAQKPSALDAQIIGGTQDNGTTYSEEGVQHDMVFGADGVSVGVGQIQSFDEGFGGNFYLGFQFGNIFWVNTLGDGRFIKPTDTTQGQFITLFQLDQDNPDTLYYVDFQNLYRTNEAPEVTPDTWTLMESIGETVGSPDNPSSEFVVPIMEITPSRGTYTTDSKLYIGDFHGRVWRLDDPANAAVDQTPVDITPNGASRLFQTAATGIAVDPYDDNVVMVTYNNYGVPGIFFTEDAGDTWSNVQGNLQLPAKFSVAIANADGVRQYFVGTTAGLWRALELNGDNTLWQLVAPEVIGVPWVMDLDYRPSDGNLLIGTYGNGMYELKVEGLPGSDMKYRVHLPEIRRGAGEETMVTLLNPSSATVAVDVHAFNVDGQDLGAATGIDSLDAGALTRFTIDEAFPTNADQVAWLQIGSGDEIHAFAELRSTTSRSAYAAENLRQLVFLPHIAQNTALFETVTSVINGGATDTPTTLSVPPVDAEFDLGGAAQAFGKTEAAITQFLGDDLVNGPALYGLADSVTGALAGMEYFRRLPSRSQEASLSLNDANAETLRFLHVATDTAQFWTGMVYINIAGETASVTESVYDSEGQLLIQNQRTLEPGAKKTLLFDANNQNEIPAGAAWVEVTGDQNLIGYELFGSPQGSGNDTFAGLQGSYDNHHTLIYPFAQSESEGFTGIVAVNLSASASDLTFEAVSADGAVLASTQVQAVGGKVKLVRLASQLFSTETLAQTAWIRAVSPDQVWAGFQLWGDQGANRQFLSGINAFGVSSDE